MKEVVKGLNKKIRRVNDFPQKGVVFWDMSTLFKDKRALHNIIDALVDNFKDLDIDYVASIESRGFIMGSALAYRLDAGFVMIRKKGKLPYDVVEADYEKEYGKDTIQMHEDAIEEGSKVLLVDDLLATGNTILAAEKLIKQAGGKVQGYGFIVELLDFNAGKRLENGEVFSLIVSEETE